ncbi:DNA-binding GntR family transcriptional regulator [Arthrobacter sp. CAN_A214]|uniref:GntR family transcriptional regulator n=1 Tax=Arthrobacter sp. CAN_A214 TaxID=2787720 RepID=UPI001A2323C1
MTESTGMIARRLDAPQSRIDQVIAEIRSAILTRRLVPGQALVEAELARAMGVSKTPVREALKVLSQSGLVTFVPYRGASVTTVDEDFIRSVYEVRLLLEPEGVRRSVNKGSRQSLTTAAELLAQSKEAALADDRGTLSLLNRRLHSELYAGCGNPILIDILENLRDRAALISVIGWEGSPTWQTEWQEHSAILKAASSGDGDQAAELLRAHLQGFFDRTLTSFRVSVKAARTINGTTVPGGNTQ